MTTATTALDPKMGSKPDRSGVLTFHVVSAVRLRRIPCTLAGVRICRWLAQHDGSSHATRVIAPVRFGMRIYLVRRKIRQLFPCLLVLALLALISLAAPAYAQTPEVAARPSGPFSYEVGKETTLRGTVSSVLEKPSPGMIMGAHLLLETSSGTVDASLGRFALIGRDALSVSAGQPIQVTGVMKALQGKQVFLVRTVKANGLVYPIRNKHGLPLSPQTRERLRQSGQTEEQL
jgi:hypothetical protein